MDIKIGSIIKCVQSDDERDLHMIGKITQISGGYIYLHPVVVSIVIDNQEVTDYTKYFCALMVKEEENKAELVDSKWFDIFFDSCADHKVLDDTKINKILADFHSQEQPPTTA